MITMNYTLLKSFCTDVKNPGTTILHYAVRCGSTKVIDFILQKHKGKRNLTIMNYQVNYELTRKLARESETITLRNVKYIHQLMCVQTSLVPRPSPRPVFFITCSMQIQRGN